MLEPGLDEHEWATRYEVIEEDLRGAPAESLSGLDEHVAESLYDSLLDLGPSAGAPA